MTHASLTLLTKHCCCEKEVALRAARPQLPPEGLAALSGMEKVSPLNDGNCGVAAIVLGLQLRGNVISQRQARPLPAFFPQRMFTAASVAKY